MKPKQRRAVVDAIPDSTTDVRRAAATERAVRKGSVAQKSTELVYGDRNKSYGDAIDDYNRAARIMNSIKDKGDTNDYTGKQMALCMVAVKLSRRQHQYKEDTYVDIAGYNDIVHMFEQAEQDGN